MTASPTSEAEDGVLAMAFSEHTCSRNNNNNNNMHVQKLNIDGTLLDSSTIAAVLIDAGNFNNNNNNCQQQQPHHRRQQPSKIREVTLRNVSIDATVLQGANELFRHPNNRTTTRTTTRTRSTSTSSSSNNNGNGNKSDYDYDYDYDYWTTPTSIDIIHCSGLVSELIRIVLPYTEIFGFTGNIPIAHNLDSEGLQIIGKDLAAGGNTTNTNINININNSDDYNAEDDDNKNNNNNNNSIGIIKLKTLILKGTRLESSGFGLFCEGLGVNTTLENLQLSNCTLEDDDVLLLASTLRKNRNLKSLFLANCKFGSKNKIQSSFSFDSSSSSSSQQQHDDHVVSIIQTNPQKHLPIVLEAMIRHPTLQSLKIYDMYCNKQSIRAIGDMLSSPETKLRHLGLKNNLSHPESKLIDGGAGDHYLFQALSHNRCLTYLKLSGNNLNDDDMVGLSRILTESKTCAIKTLSLTDNLVSHGLLSLASRLTDAKSLRCLDVQRNLISDQSKKAMVSALKNNVQLERLDLDGSWDTEKFWWLSLNRGGRRALQTTGNNKSVPTALWPTILERAYNLQFGRSQNQNQNQSSSSCTTNVDIVYYMIRRIPSLFENVVVVPVAVAVAVGEEPKQKHKRQRKRVVKIANVETKPTVKRKFNV